MIPDGWALRWRISGVVCNSLKGVSEIVDLVLAQAFHDLRWHPILSWGFFVRDGGKDIFEVPGIANEGVDIWQES